jgi:hypothetical protein
MMTFEGEQTSCPKWFPFALSGIGLASLALSHLFW